MQLIFHFPPDNLPLAFLFWLVSLVFMKWSYDLYRNREKGVTIIKPFRPYAVRLPFYIYPGKISKESLEKRIGKSIIGATYLSGLKLKTWIFIFLIIGILVFLIGFIEILDSRV